MEVLHLGDGLERDVVRTRAANTQTQTQARNRQSCQAQPLHSGMETHTIG
jgi:hypothetical protein